MGLTPELSRTDLRRGGVVHVTAQAEPRSGLGLNELLGLNFNRGIYALTLSRSGVVIPAFMGRELLAGQARGVAPLIATAWANTASPERVPNRAAACPRAQPAILTAWLPRTNGTVDFRLRHCLLLRPNA